MRTRMAFRCSYAVAFLLVCALHATAQQPVRFEFDLEYQHRLATRDLLIEPYDLKSGIDLMRSYFDRPPFARLLLEGRSPAGFGVLAETVLRDQWTGDYFRSDNIPVLGAEGDPVQVENYFFTKAAVFYDSPLFSFHFGREQPDYNGIIRGGLLPGPRLPYLDAVRASGTIGRMTLEWMVATIPAIQSWETASGTLPGFDVDPNEGVSPAGASYYGWESSPYSRNPASTIIVEGLNRLNWQVGRVRLGLADHAMMARRENRFYVTDFIPVLSRHQAGIGQTNNSLIFEFGWEPLDGLEFAAQAGFDDINADFAGLSDTGTPTVSAFAGALSFKGNSPAGSLRARMEAGYTHWLWGNYDGAEIWPNDTNPFLRFQYRYLSDAAALLLPLSSPYGPGVFWFTASTGILLDSLNLDTEAEISYLSKNTDANLIDTPVIGNSSTEGAPRTRFISAALNLRWSLKTSAAGRWEISARPELCGIDGDWWFELRLGSALRLR